MNVLDMDSTGLLSRPPTVNGRGVKRHLLGFIFPLNHAVRLAERRFLVVVATLLLFDWFRVSVSLE
jgi:hypothetical protein